MGTQDSRRQDGSGLLDEIRSDEQAEQRGGDAGAPLAEDIDEQSFLDLMEPAKKSLTLFFLIDISDSMNCEIEQDERHRTKMEAVNDTMRALLPQLAGLGGADAAIYLVVMAFSEKVQWITPSPVRAEDFTQWRDLQAFGRTYVGDVFEQLAQVMSRKAFFNRPSLSYAPILFLMTDGQFMSRSGGNWQDSLRTLEKNKWFQSSVRFGIGLGDEPNMRELARFTDNVELTVRMTSAEQIVDMIPFITVSSATIGSQSIASYEDLGSCSDEEIIRRKRERYEEVVREARSMGGVSAASVDTEEGW